MIEDYVNDEYGATIINIVGSSIVPQILEINHKTFEDYLKEHYKAGNVDDGHGISILFNYPNATSVMLASSLSPSIGHVLAPKAAVYIQSCNYNGCIIGNSIAVQDAEGHLWPYNGHKGTIIPTREEFDAVKTVSGGTPTGSQIYTFKLEKYENGKWEVVKTAQNDGRSISFGKIEFKQAGTFYYRISEDVFRVSGVTPDNTEYIAKVVVESNTSGSDIVYTHTTEYFKLNDGATNPVVGSGFGTLDNSKVIKLENPVTLSFNNQIEKKNITVNKKWFRGTDVTSTTTSPASIKFDLYRTTNSIPSSSPVDASTLLGYNGSRVNTDDNRYTISAPDWSLTIPDLDKYDTVSGNEWHYYAI